MATQGTPTKLKRQRLSVDIPDELRWKLKQIATIKQMFFQDYLKDVLDREAKRHSDQPTSAN